MEVDGETLNHWWRSSQIHYGLSWKQDNARVVAMGEVARWGAAAEKQCGVTKHCLNNSSLTVSEHYISIYSIALGRKMDWVPLEECVYTCVRVCVWVCVMFVWLREHWCWYLPTWHPFTQVTGETNMGKDNGAADNVWNVDNSPEPGWPCLFVCTNVCVCLSKCIHYTTTTAKQN